MQRDTLIDFFRDLITTRGEFLVYDDGYRRRSHSYEDLGRAARVHRGRIGTFRDGRRDLDDELVSHGFIVWPHRTELPRPLFSRVRGGPSQCT